VTVTRYILKKSNL